MRPQKRPRLSFSANLLCFRANVRVRQASEAEGRHEGVSLRV
jgi:hypothetical protein